MRSSILLALNPCYAKRLYLKINWEAPYYVSTVIMWCMFLKKICIKSNNHRLIGTRVQLCHKEMCLFRMEDADCMRGWPSGGDVWEGLQVFLLPKVPLSSVRPAVWYKSITGYISVCSANKQTFVLLINFHTLQSLLLK